MLRPRHLARTQSYAGQVTNARIAAHTSGTMKGSMMRKPSSTSPASNATVMSRRSHGAETKSSTLRPREISRARRRPRRTWSCARSMQVASVSCRRRFRYAGGSTLPRLRCSYSQKPPDPTTSSASAALSAQHHRDRPQQCGGRAPAMRTSSHGSRPASASPKCTAPTKASSTAPQASATCCASSRAAYAGSSPTAARHNTSGATPR